MTIQVAGGGETAAFPVEHTHIANALACIVGEPITLSSPWPPITGISSIGSSPHDLVVVDGVMRAPGPHDPAGTVRVLELVDGTPIPHAPIEPAPLRIILSAPGRCVFELVTADGASTTITLLACEPGCLTFLPDDQHAGGCSTNKRRVLRELARHTAFDGTREHLSTFPLRQYGA